MKAYKEITVRVPADFEPPEGMDVDYYEYRGLDGKATILDGPGWRTSYGVSLGVPWLVAVPKKPPLIPDDAYAIAHPRCKVRVRNSENDPWQHSQLVYVPSDGKFLAIVGPYCTYFNQCEVIED